SKYCLLLIISTLGIGVSLIFSIGINLYIESDILLKGFGFSVIGVTGILFFYSIIIPIITKLGVEKARIIIIIVFMLPMGIVYLLMNSLNNEATIIPEQILEIGRLILQYKYIIVPIAIVIALSISYNISVKIYRKKQF
ncbi:MAG: hypothetical protein GX915_01135, partial [Clostridiales bacterium]|nr:hypothetical protein [Clostridiales bacterium]